MNDLWPVYQYHTYVSISIILYSVVWKKTTQMTCSTSWKERYRILKLFTEDLMYTENWSNLG